MLSRRVAALFFAAGILAAPCAQAAPAQSRNFDHTVAGTDPVARFFGFSSSPVAAHDGELFRHPRGRAPS